MNIKPFLIVPRLPESIAHLGEIAMNTWFSWNWAAMRLFIRLDPVMWERCRQNLMLMLGTLPQETLEEAARDDSFIANLDQVHIMLQAYLHYRTWFDEVHKDDKGLQAVYFSMEYGISVDLQIYSGGLGILAGDHLKSSSDLGIPLVAVGLLYQKGYLQQLLNSDGWQEEHYLANDWHNMPVVLERDGKGKPLTIEVDLAAEKLKAHIWRVTVGRVPLYLLDTNIPENPPHLRHITAQLYGGDRENRLRQEILLGIGGVRALEKLGLKPTVYHMNEGHSAFMALERIRILMEQQKLSFHEAREVVWASSVFTTHTPVPAGNEVFDIGLVKRYLGSFAQQLGLGWNEFAQLGQMGGGGGQDFVMTVLALKLAAHCNAVSRLHGRTARRMWQGHWLGLPEKEVPIEHVTNGIHTRTWLSHDMDELMLRYIGPQFIEEPHDPKLWERVDNIPDIELWRIHQIRKERLIFYARKCLKNQLLRRGAGEVEIRMAEEVLESDVLTIGLARRFAAYKRAYLFILDPDRIRKMLTDAERPVQFIVAGKAHPQDAQGKEIIRKLVHFSSEPAVRPRIVFVEDYDINVARYMVQGVDVWLSTSRRPNEASGTSGMKAAANGALNASTLDGWWEEAYSPEVGWAIGTGRTYDDPDEQDRIEAEALYNLLEHEIIPLYYHRDRTDLPRDWIAMMKRSMKRLGGHFNTHRMVMDYCEHYYLPAHRAAAELAKEQFKWARELVKWRLRVSEKWSGVRLVSERSDQEQVIQSGDPLAIRARAQLNGLAPEDIAVEVLYGPLDADEKISDGEVVRLNNVGSEAGEALFSGEIPCRHSGRHGWAVRVRPDHPDLFGRMVPLTITWE